MSLWSRIANVFRDGDLSREIAEELESHIQEAVARGRDPIEARKAFGSLWKRCDESREIRVVGWLDSFYRWIDSFRTDSIFAFRQLRKNKVTSTAAILSLALAVGACTSAFRLIDALLLRPLPVAHPDRLYALFRHSIGSDGKPRTDDAYEYPLFEQMRSAVKEQADLIAISYSYQLDLTYGSDQEIEKADAQYVSGSVFTSFGLRPELGRLLTESDDVKPGEHPYAVLSNTYWTQRFGRDPNVIGRTFKMGNGLFTIVGVVQGPFTGTEPGVMTDVFLPTMMYEGAKHSDWAWFRIFAHLNPGADPKVVLNRLQTPYAVFNAERAKSAFGMPKSLRERFFHQTLSLDPAAAGVSTIQKDNRFGLLILGVLVVLVLLIACANIANLMTAHALARAREIAVRVSLGARRWRLVQLLLLESAWLAVLASTVGLLFAWWSAPLVVSMINPPNHPVRLVLAADWRVFGFLLSLTIFVTAIFGIIPALRASLLEPISALKGGEDPHARHRLSFSLIAAQIAFCLMVLLLASVFVTTFDRLSHQPTGFSAERLLTLDTVGQSPQPPEVWEQLVEHLRTVPGVESVALARMPLLISQQWNGLVSINHEPPRPELVYFLDVSPGWMETMKIPLLDGRDFLRNDTYPGAAVVNEAFAKRYFNGEDPVGKFFEKPENGRNLLLHIVGLAKDAHYHDMREPLTPTVYVPFRSMDAAGKFQPKQSATIIVKTSSENPLALASVLRQDVPRARTEFRVSNIRTQTEIDRAQMVRERLMATLAVFFAAVALLLAGIGLYGVLNYSVIQRRREIGIRMAVGASSVDIAREVTASVFSMVATGAIAGLSLGMASIRFIQALLYQTKATDTRMLAIPGLTLFLAAIIATLPPVLRALRIDPVWCLRAE